MHFVKMHGLGNDFVVVDGSAERIPADPAGPTPTRVARGLGTPELARRICDRHAGVGADGFILVLPPERGVDAALRMRIWNADGAEPEMCGNGIRCVCKLAYDRGLCRETPMRIQTGRGVLALTYALDEDGRVQSVTVGMGEPILDAGQIPVVLGGLRRIVDARLGPVPEWDAFAGAWRKECGLDERLTCVSMGNPHAILYCKDVGSVPLAFVGPFLENNPIFPNRANVHFVEVLSSAEVRIRTWERGAGATQACGTGASAVCVAGVLTGRTGRRIRAHLPGGDLDLEWGETDNQVRMTGPAALVFSGEWPD